MTRSFEQPDILDPHAHSTDRQSIIVVTVDGEDGRIRSVPAWMMHETAIAPVQPDEVRR